MTVACLCLIAADRAMSSAQVDLPTAGRAAMTIIWPGCRPLVRASKSVKPVGTPTMSPLDPDACLDLVDRGLEHVAEDVVVLAAALVGDRVDLGLGGLTMSSTSPLALAVADLDDAGAGVDQPAQHRALGDDLRVVAGVGRRRHGRDELVQVGLAAHPVMSPRLVSSSETVIASAGSPRP